MQQINQNQYETYNITKLRACLGSNKKPKSYELVKKYINLAIEQGNESVFKMGQSYSVNIELFKSFINNHERRGLLCQKQSNSLNTSISGVIYGGSVSHTKGLSIAEVLKQRKMQRQLKREMS